MGKQKTVRLTDEAHALLTEKAVNYEESMKDIASEAIMLLVEGKERNKECYALLDNQLEKVKRAQKVLAFYTMLAGSAGLILGVITGVMI